MNRNQGSTCNNVIYMYNYVIILILVRAHGPSIFITFFFFNFTGNKIIIFTFVFFNLNAPKPFLYYKSILIPINIGKYTCSNIKQITFNFFITQNHIDVTLNV